VSRIEGLFARLRAEGRLGLFPFVTVGYPQLQDTAPVALAMLEAGADLVELGMPFSDPLAEGRTVQRSTQVALRNGVTLGLCLETAWTCRQRTEAPLVLMGYLNPILRFGIKRFCQGAADAGVDGLIVADLSLEEAGGLAGECRANGIDLVLFLAPTSTEERIRTVARLASGFIYCVSVTGVTGRREDVSTEVDGMLRRIRAHTDLPLVLGFGISKPEHLLALHGKADAVAVGSAVIDAIDPDRPAASAADFVRYLRGGAPVAG